MKQKEFSKLCQPFNIQYRDIFGSIPCPDDFVHSHETFLEALKKSIETKEPIETYLKKSTKPTIPDGLI